LQDCLLRPRCTVVLSRAFPSASFVSYLILRCYTYEAARFLGVC
jgi:hypothetical protein